jgi:hypothetical protein
MNWRHLGKMTDDFDWLEPMKTRTRQLEEETKRIREENAKQKPPRYLTLENPWNKLGRKKFQTYTLFSFIVKRKVFMMNYDTILNLV